MILKRWRYGMIYGFGALLYKKELETKDNLSGMSIKTKFDPDKVLEQIAFKLYVM